MEFSTSLATRKQAIISTLSATVTQECFAQIGEVNSSKMEYKVPLIALLGTMVESSKELFLMFSHDNDRFSDKLKSQNK